MADVSEAVRQYADAIMLSAESAIGAFPEKALSVLRAASERMESWSREENMQRHLPQYQLAIALPDQISEQICTSAVEMGILFSCVNKLQNIQSLYRSSKIHVLCYTPRSKQPCRGRHLRMHKAWLHGVAPVTQPSQPSHFRVHRRRQHEKEHEPLLGGDPASAPAVE